jgi:type I restriction-modification system DNA methylase subunit
MLNCLTREIEVPHHAHGTDVLGGFYEQHLYRKGAAQYFTPWPICQFMAQITHADEAIPEIIERHWPIRKRILDPSCGSGRMLIAGRNVNGRQHEYYGIDIDHTCVKMAAINLFLHGMFHSEVMWADALRPGDFQMSYRISFLPFGIFRITDKEQSPLYHMNAASWKKEPVFPDFEETDRKPMHGPQLTIF